MLEWKKRCRKDQTLVADRKIWGTKCENYRIIFSHIRYGEGVLADKYYALKNQNDSWDIIGRHKTRKAAETTCEKNLKLATKKTKKKKRRPK